MAAIALVAKDSLSTIQSTTVLLAVHGALFGYFLTEIGIYFVRFPKDRIGFRILVYWLTLAQCVYLAVKIGNFITMVNRIVGNQDLNGNRLYLTFAPVLITVFMEGTAEGFFAWRLCAISKKWWMKTIAVMLWAFSTLSHIIWVTMVGVAWQLSAPDAPDPPRLRILLLMSFWGTAAENLWISSCLIYELAFSRDRKALRGTAHSTSISKLVSLAMRTSAVLIVFELLVAIIVSVGNQNEVALSVETSFATAIYTVLSSIVVLHTLNYRTKIREASPNFSSPIFFGPIQSSTRHTTTTRSRSTGTTSSRREGGGGGGGGGREGPSEGGETLESNVTRREGDVNRSCVKVKEKKRSSQEKKKKRTRGGGGEREIGLDSTGTGITVQTVSWTMEEEDNRDPGHREDTVEMVVERGKKQPETNPRGGFRRS